MYEIRGKNKWKVSLILTLNRYHIVLVLVHAVLVLFLRTLNKLMSAGSVPNNVPNMFKINNEDKRATWIGFVLVSYALILNAFCKKLFTLMFFFIIIIISNIEQTFPLLRRSFFLSVLEAKDFLTFSGGKEMECWSETDNTGKHWNKKKHRHQID